MGKNQLNKIQTKLNLTCPELGTAQPQLVCKCNQITEEILDRNICLLETYMAAVSDADVISNFANSYQT